MVKLYGLLAVILVLSGCSGDNSHTELRSFIETTKNQKASRIEPVATYPPYEAFVYASTSLRSPFDKPIDLVQVRGKKSDVEPDFSRVREYLEGFDFESLSMVGTLSKGADLWALIRTASGGISRVEEGNFLGKNHGKITSINAGKVDLIEIVSDGLDGWVERPRLSSYRM